ncbi:hypothetical protein TWF730_006805 [Orbilia blumenaviensis]|uniref:B30.2/SPRY domain-containing protein n=1 Tax=Orbilia blumenaviensis TaxID=1796055 RepID=A0AAV9VHP3_9PEZI
MALLVRIINSLNSGVLSSQHIRGKIVQRKDRAARYFGPSHFQGNLLGILELQFSFISKRYHLLSPSIGSDSKFQNTLPHFQEIEQAVAVEDAWSFNGVPSLWDLLAHVEMAMDDQLMKVGTYGPELGAFISGLHHFRPPLRLYSSVENSSMSWVFKTSQYNYWHSAKIASILAIVGEPGSGVSIISTHILYALHLNEAGSIVLQFAFNKAVMDQTSISSMLGSLIRQMILENPSIHAKVLPHLSNLQSKGSYTQYDLAIFFRTLIRSFWSTAPTYMVIANINECATGPKSVLEMLDSILSIGGPHMTTIKIVVTADPSYEDFHQKKGDSLAEAGNETRNSYIIVLGEESDMDEAVNSMVDRRISALTYTNAIWGKLKEDVYTKITSDKPDFLLAHNRLLHLENPDTRSTTFAIRSLVQSIPKTVTEFYEKILSPAQHHPPENIMKKKFYADQKWATTALGWLAHSFRPLKQNELAVVLAMTFNGVDLENLCEHCPWNISGDVNQIFPGTTSLVRDEIHLAHSSLRDFLMRMGLNSDPQSNVSFHKEIVQTCFDYLKLVKEHPTVIRLISGVGDYLSPTETLLPHLSSDISLELLEYVVNYWPQHFKAGFEEPLNSESHGGLSQDTGTHDGTESDEGHQDDNTNTSPNLESSVEDTKSVADPVAERPTVLERLFEDKELLVLWSELHSLFNNSTLKSPILDSPLKLAARYGLVNLISLVQLRAVQSPPIMSSEGAPLRGYGGSTDETTNQELGSNNSEEEQIDEEPTTSEDGKLADENIELTEALEVACQHGHLEIVKLLETSGIKSAKALSLAATSGHENIVLFLLSQNKIDILELPVEACVGLVKLMAGSGMKSAIQLLFQLRPATPEFWAAEPSQNLHIALKSAVESGHEDVVEFLVSLRPARSDFHDAECELLSTASKFGFTKIAQLLLGDDSPGSENCYPALCAAAATGQVDSVLLFIKSLGHQTDLSISKRNPTPIEIAASHGHWFVVQELISEFKAASTPLRPKLERRRTPDRIRQSNSRNKGDGRREKSLGREEGKLSGKEGTLSIFQGVLHAALRIAASNGHVRVVKILLEAIKETLDGDTSICQGISKDEGSRNALHLAASQGHKEVLLELLNSGFPIDSTTDEMWTVVSFAAYGGFSDILEALVRRKAEVTVFDKKGNTPHHLAMQTGSLAVIKILQSQSDNARIANEHGETPLMLAVKRGNPLYVEELLAGGPRSRSEDRYESKVSLIHTALKKKNLEIVRLLAHAGEDCCDRDELGNHPLILATTWDDDMLTVMTILLKGGADINAQDEYGETALHKAVIYNNLPVCELLINEGANRNIQSKEEKSPLYIAAYDGYKEIVLKLLQGGEPKIFVNAKNLNGWTALHGAYDSAPITLALLRAGADPNACNNSGATPMSFAAQTDQEEVLEILINHNGLVNGKDKKGWTPCHYATIGDSIATFKLLISHKADINQVDSLGMTPLHFTITHQSVSIFDYITHHIDADINHVSESKGTPLTYAARKGSEDFVGALLTRNADLYAYGGKYHSALQAAASSGNSEIVKLILERKPNINAFGGKFGTALSACIKKRHNAITELLLMQEGVDVNFCKEEFITPIQAAAQHGDPEILESLIQKGGDIHKFGGKHISALHAAIGARNLAVIKILLNNEVDPRKTEEGKDLPIQLACKVGEIDIYSLLRKHGADLVLKNPNKPEIKSSLEVALDSNSLSLLAHLLDVESAYIKDEKHQIGERGLERAVALSESADVITQIIRSGINPNNRNQEHKTPLITAVANNKIDITTALLEYGADASIMDGQGKNALAWATLTGNLEIFDMVLESLRSKENLPSCCIRALHMAISRGDEYIVRRILGEGVDPSIRDINNWLPIEIAESYGHEEIKNLLTLRQAEPPSGIYTAQNAPTKWNEFDKNERIKLTADHKGISIDDDTGIKSTSGQSVARANFCIPFQGNLSDVGGDDVFYYEITISSKGMVENLDGSLVSFGFCDEEMDLDYYLGWHPRSWGIHSDDGVSYINGEIIEIYRQPFDIGDVVGCGVSLQRGVAFFTVNGVFLGVFSQDVGGQIYPAVSINNHLVGLEISVNFGSPDAGGFIYKYSPEDLIEDEAALPVPHMRETRNAEGVFEQEESEGSELDTDSSPGRT